MQIRNFFLQIFASFFAKKVVTATTCNPHREKGGPVIWRFLHISLQRDNQLQDPAAAKNRKSSNFWILNSNFILLREKKRFLKTGVRQSIGFNRNKAIFSNPVFGSASIQCPFSKTAGGKPGIFRVFSFSHPQCLGPHVFWPTMYEADLGSSHYCPLMAPNLLIMGLQNITLWSRWI